jgi:sugar (pentulose or hexulose) kinase
MVTAEPMHDPAERLWAGAHLVPAAFVLESNAGSSGITYRWCREMFCQALQAQAAERQISVYELMNATAASVPPGADGIQSFVGILKMNAKDLIAPRSVINFGPRAFGLSDRSQTAAVTRAVIESLAYGVKVNLDQVLEVSGEAPRALRVCGGLARSELYLDILASVTQLPLIVPHWREGSAVGAALCAGLGAGVFENFESGIEALQAFSEHQPDPVLVEAYGPLYAAWQTTHHALMQVAM